MLVDLPKDIMTEQIDEDEVKSDINGFIDTFTSKQNLPKEFESFVKRLLK